LRVMRCTRQATTNTGHLMYVSHCHTATHCNRLQHPATHCNTRQQIPTQYTTLQRYICTSMHAPATTNTALCKYVLLYCTLQHPTTHCDTLQHTAAHCNTVQHTATHLDSAQHIATLYHTMRAIVKCKCDPSDVCFRM